jgi:hypothetical protein
MCLRCLRSAPLTKIETFNPFNRRWTRMNADYRGEDSRSRQGDNYFISYLRLSASICGFNSLLTGTFYICAAVECSLFHFSSTVRL